MHSATLARRVGCLLVLVSSGLPATASAGGGACCFPDDICLDGIDGGDWLLIHLPDGNEGWIPAHTAEVI